jgi:hypothetical protein
MSSLARILCTLVLSLTLLAAVDGRRFLRGQPGTLRVHNQTDGMHNQTNGTVYRTRRRLDGMHNQTNGTVYDYKSRRRVNGTDYPPLNETDWRTRRRLLNGTDYNRTLMETDYRARRLLNGTDYNQTVYRARRRLNGTDYNRTLMETDYEEDYDENDRHLEELTDEEIELLEGRNPCDRVLPQIGDDLSARKFCLDYETLPYIMPECSEEDEIVPMIFHSIGKDGSQEAHQQITATANPEFVRNHRGDADALDYIKDWCGSEVASAYSCMAAPAFRADIFRFCALYAQGGVYLDNDIMPLVQLKELYSPCSVATVGHDIPQGGVPGKQMKILAGAPGAPIFKCMLDRIVENVRHRAYPDSCLAVSGPALLHECYTENSGNVAITYHDTRNAMWPYTGMRQGNKVISYEIAVSKKFFEEDKTDYGYLFANRQVYKEECPLSFSPSVEDSVEH